MEHFGVNTNLYWNANGHTTSWFDAKETFQYLMPNIAGFGVSDQSEVNTGSHGDTSF